ncbi:DUF317 domain-containing protein [Streptomyces sp. NPDC017405]|uniref:DUF317 domain-containing protein n=1 Tax=unclassified Streptomyces TaxID=2593676 RepID=UPI00379CCDF2
MEVPLNPDIPLDPSAPDQIPPSCWVGPRHLAGDDGRLYDTVADTLTALGWTSLTMVRGRQEPDEAPEDRQVVRSTVLHLGPDTLRWAQWVLADEPFLLGDLPIAWHVSARTDTSSPLAQWSAYFTSDVPGEAVADFLVALHARRHPATPSGGRELVLEAVTGHGWLLDIDQPHAGAMDATFTTHISYGAVPPLIQDGDPQTLTREVGEELEGWQAWSEPVLGGRCLWAASFSSGVPDDLVAAFARSVSSTAPVLRRALPDSTRDRLLRAPAI